MDKEMAQVKIQDLYAVPTSSLLTSNERFSKYIKRLIVTFM